MANTATNKPTRVRLSTPWYVWLLAVLFVGFSLALLLGPASWSHWFKSDVIGGIADWFA